MDNQEVIVGQGTEINTIRDPNAILAEAKKAAEALMSVVKQKKNPVIMNGEQYIEFEDWQVLGKFYGLTAKVTKTTFIDFGGAKGFEACADLIRVSDGAVLSSAEAMCLNDEDKWSTRTKYEYRDILDEHGKKIWVAGKDGKKHPKSEKVKVGDVPVPLFQLKSMAQTRACAKAMRNVLAWVVVMAGFKPNVAEEMTGDETLAETPATGKPDVDMPQAKAPTPAAKPEPAKPAAPSAEKKANTISVPQAKRLYAIAHANGYTKEEVDAYLSSEYELSSANDIERESYEWIVQNFSSPKNKDE